MAKILLNVELEPKTFQAQLQKIKEQLDQTFSGTGGAGGGVGGGIKAAKAQVESLQKSFANLLNTLKGSESKYASDTFKNLKTQITNALNATKALNKEMGNGKPTEEQRKEYARLNKQLSTLSSSFATVRVESEKLQKDNKLAIPNVDNLQKKYANLLNTIKGTEKYYAKGTFSSLTSEIRANLTSLQQLDPTTADYAIRVNELDKQLNKLSAQFAETRASSQNMHGSFLEIVKGFAKFQLSAMIVMKPLQMIRNAWEDLNETLVETEDAVVALRRVAGEAANANDLYDLAQRYGQTFENVSELATNFARAGYDWNETIKATEAALLALNTAELDATEASDGMIAILQQFGYEADQLESIIDKLNITADNAAVATDGLLKALSRTGSSAKNARLSLEETVAVVTALSEATGRSGENIGTALNSLIQFSTKASALDTFSKLGGDVEKTVELYRQGGATVLDIWEELSKVISSNQTAESILGENFTTEEFESLNEELKQALGENFAQTTEIYDTASTFRKNYFIALLQNLDQVQESLDTMNKAQGYSQKENAQYIDTYTAKVNALEAKWQDIANDEQGLLGIKKDLVDIASSILDIIDFMGGFKGVIETSIAVASPFLVKLLSKQTATSLLNVGTYIKSIFTGLTTTATGATVALDKATLSARRLNVALGAIGLLLGVVTTVVNKLEDANRAKKELQEKNKNEAIERANSEATAYEETAKSLANYALEIENLRAVLDSSISSESEKKLAQEQLLIIQNNLIKSNEDYANSLDLVNGNLSTQLGLIEKMSEQELKDQALKYLQENESAINIAQSRLSKTTTSSSNTLFEANGVATKEKRKQIENTLNQIISGAGVGDNVSAVMDNTYGHAHNVGKNYVENWKEADGFLEKLFAATGIEATVESWFEKESYVGGSKGSFGISGTTEQQINSLEKMIDYVGKSGGSIGLSDEEIVSLTGELQSMLDKLQSNEYNQAKNLVEIASLDQMFISGELSVEEYLKQRYNIESSSNAVGSSTETTNLSDVVNKLESIRENTERTKELEEKQLAIEEKRQALEDAKNQRTVRVFNAETGQWEQVANQKDIDRATESLAEAEQDLKDTAWDNVLNYLKTDEAQEKLNKGEFTLPSFIAEMLARPTSDDAFQAYLNSEGILTGAVNKTPMSSGAVYNNSSNNTTNNNQSYSLNGIPIPIEEAGRYFTPEALELLNQMGD